MNLRFDETLLNDNVLDALWDMHFEQCTPIQSACIDPIIEGHDIMGVAQTGTGKTAAYLLPVLSLLDDGGFPEDAVNCLIMAPTRELAQQIDQAMQGFSYYLNGISSVAVYGGNDGSRYDQEVNALRKGASVIIATPGRLISHLQMGNLDLSRLSFFILDEADRMLDMGFSEDIITIAKTIGVNPKTGAKSPVRCQTIMFSATMPDNINTLAHPLLHNPVNVRIAVSKPAEKIQQSAYVCYPPQKLRIIKHLSQQGFVSKSGDHYDFKRVIIFSGKKQRVKDVNHSLLQMHINSGAMHSDLTQAERDDVMYRFKSGQLDVLVATDIVARGIDIDDIQMVINYDVPRDVEDYVHRIGRTARAQRDGVAITLVAEDEIWLFRKIERFLEYDITKNPLPETLGEAPEYKPVAPAPTRKKNWSKGKGRGKRNGNATANGNKSGKRKSNNKGNGNSNGKTQARSDRRDYHKKKENNK